MRWWGAQTRGHRAVSEHYRLPIFSTFGAWADAFERGEGNLSACSFTEDGGDSLHPNQNAFASRLVSQPLIDLVRRGIRLSRALKDGGRLPLPPPMSAKMAAQAAFSRCYDFTDDPKTPAHLGGMQGVRPRILASDGWHHIETEASSVKGAKYKPGIEAHTAGAVLKFELDLAGWRSPQLGLQHLTSGTAGRRDGGWRDMGRVGVRCSAGCACDQVVSGKSELRHTLLETSRVAIGCGGDGCPATCAVELRLLNESCGRTKRRDGGDPCESRFKLVRVLLEDRANASSAL